MMDTTKLNEIKAHYQEGSNADGSRKFVILTPVGNFVFKRKIEAKEFKKLYDTASKFDV